ncbi:translocon-associated protein subunit gamma isoform X2 [Bombus flavifrons]|uniref:translocon-associated protein subunit gamma isoform X2 n=1 Tax=Bombus flavifrons TaxID=103934 RepID=UPI002146CDC6
MSGKSKAFTKEEELLLQDFSRNVSTKSSALFYGNAFIVSAIPIWLFWRIHLIDIYANLISFVLVTLASTYALALAYKNTKFVLKHKIAVKREDAVTKEMSRKLSEDKKMSKKEKDERDTAGGKNKRRGSESGVSRNEKTALISSLAASSASASQK